MLPISRAEAHQLFELQDSTMVFETIIRQLYESILRPGNRAIDGGAHAAMHTIPMAKAVGPTGVVYAFEPVPHICAWLRTLVAEYPQVVVREQALADRSGQATFRVVTEKPWLSSLGCRELGGVSIQEIQVELTTLDEIDAPIKFIKLDLEGGEYHAVKGGVRLLTECKPTMALECARIAAARDFGYSATEYFSLFSATGYQLFDLFGRPFGEKEFAVPWNDRSLPDYVVATADPNVPALLNDLARSALDGRLSN